MTQLRRASATVLEARRWAEAESLFAVVDACDAPSVVSMAGQLGPERAVSLYKGGAEEEFEAIAPYLFALDRRAFDWITSDLWSEPWGVLVRSQANLETLQTHFRRFLVVTSPEGEEWYFRYYDPRVLERYLSTCNEDELSTFFGPVTAYAVTDPETYGIRVFDRDTGTALHAGAGIRVTLRASAQ